MVNETEVALRAEAGGVVVRVVQNKPSDVKWGFSVGIFRNPETVMRSHFESPGNVRLP